MVTFPALSEAPLKSPGSGLTLRYATPGDLDHLCSFFSRVLSDDEAGKPDARIGYWVHDTLTLNPANPSSPFGLLIEEDATHRIASALVGIPQTWTFAGLPVLAGRPEPVGTDEAFRKRGLVRALFAQFHSCSQARGDLLQGITGIPYFYRQFGYEMAVELGGSRSAYEIHVKNAMKADKQGRYVRLAAKGDIPFLRELFAASTQRYLMACPLDTSWWETELLKKHAESIGKTAIYILESAEKQPAGFFILSRELDDQAAVVRYVEIKSGFNWQDYMPLVIEQAWTFGQELAGKTAAACTRLCFGLGSEHPAYGAAAQYLPEKRRPYNWYLRIPDLPKFMRHIAPVLEKRIAHSPFSAYSGQVKISFYRSDLHLEFQSGLLTKAESAPPSIWHKADVCFPDLTFLQLVFGYRSARELAEFFADCRVPEKFIPFLDVLFPKQTSLIFPVE